jgi:hypothetical protein
MTAAGLPAISQLTLFKHRFAESALYLARTSSFNLSQPEKTRQSMLVTLAGTGMVTDVRPEQAEKPHRQ